MEFFKGETLKATDLSKIRVSYSTSFAYDYLGEEVPFEELHVLAQAPGMSWCNHHFLKGHRTKENAIPGFNLLVFDVDGGMSLELAHDLLKETMFLTYTTKRHRTAGHGDRYRILLPTNYVLELDDDEYKQFYNEVREWLPFKAANPDADIDESANQRSKKFLSHEGGLYHYNLNGALLDVLPFIPKTSRNESYKEGFKAISSFDNLERWFAQKIVQGNRNNQMIRYALALVDNGLDLTEVINRVRAFDQKLPEPLGDDELNRSIFITVAKRYQKQAA